MHLGYWSIGIDGKAYYAHRLAFFYVTGRWPKYVDHIDQDGTNNVWANLRECTQSENQGNTRAHADAACPYKGVYFNKQKGRWHAQIMRDGKKRSLGLHATPELAAEAYAIAARDTFGPFARTTSP